VTVGGIAFGFAASCVFAVVVYGIEEYCAARRRKSTRKEKP
jgi:Na+(H+)/acetate symporter ActP